MIESQGLLARATALGEIFRDRLQSLAEQCEIVGDVRVVGLMIGIDLSVAGGPVVEKCLEQGLLVNCTQGSVIRLLPAMTLTDEDAHQGCEILGEVLQQLADA
jgi:4-aminobutyrate aminotransferase-like enzyme